MVHKSEVLTTYGYQITLATLHRSCNIKLSWIYYAGGEKKKILYVQLLNFSIKERLSDSCKQPQHPPWGYGSTVRCPLSWAQCSTTYRLLVHQRCGVPGFSAFLLGFQCLLHAWSNPEVYLWPVYCSPAEAWDLIRLWQVMQVSKSWYKTSALWYFTKGGTCGTTWWPLVWERLLGPAEWMPSSHPHLTVTGCNALHVGCWVWHPFTSIFGGQWRRKENINSEDMWQIWTGEPKTLDTWKSVHTTLASPSSVTTSVMDGICTTHLFLVCGLLPHACGRGRRLLPWGSSEHCW